MSMIEQAIIDDFKIGLDNMMTTTITDSLHCPPLMYILTVKRTMHAIYRQWFAVQPIPLLPTSIDIAHGRKDMFQHAALEGLAQTQSQSADSTLLWHKSPSPCLGFSYKLHKVLLSLSHSLCLMRALSVSLNSQSTPSPSTYLPTYLPTYIGDEETDDRDTNPRM